MGPEDAVIEDRTTGLHWMRCRQGQHWNFVICDGDAAWLTWDAEM
jgi:hypothetical protein